MVLLPSPKHAQAGNDQAGHGDDLTCLGGGSTWAAGGGTVVPRWRWRYLVPLQICERRDLKISAGCPYVAHDRVRCKQHQPRPHITNRRPACPSQNVSA